MSQHEVNESALEFSCEGETLHGVLASPRNHAVSTGVLVVVGGPQYRVGSHRQFVQLSRVLAAAGIACLRFDVRGMGDSTGELLDFESIDDDIRAALETLRRAVPTLQRVVMWGLCDGASAALLHLERHPGAAVDGLVLVNPWVRTETSQARTRVKHYYASRLTEAAFWGKLFQGGVGIGAIKGLLSNLRLAGSKQDPEPKAHYTRRMARGWHGFEGARLLALSDSDYTAREFEEFASTDPEWQRALQRRPPQRLVLEGADHTCSRPAATQQLEAATLAFLRSMGHAG